jgi:hypothetical protein
MRYAVDRSIDRAIDVETRRFNQSIREAYLFLILAVSLGVNIGLVMTRQAFQDRPYVDGTEANGILDAGFIIADPDGFPVLRFNADGTHDREESASADVQDMLEFSA